MLSSSPDGVGGVVIIGEESGEATMPTAGKPEEYSHPNPSSSSKATRATDPTDISR